MFQESADDKMAITGVARFLRSVIELPSFPVFCAYLLMVISSNIYKNYTKPLEFRRVGNSF